jgi:hypothetical protein
VGTLVVGLAAFGLLNPPLAAFIHVSSELAFISNSARLLPAVSGPGATTARAQALHAPAGAVAD